VQRDVRARLYKIPGILSSIFEAGGFHGEKVLQVNITGEEIDKLKEYSRTLKKAVGQVPGIVDLEATMEHDIPEFKIAVDRQRAIDSGINSSKVATTLGALVGGQVVSTFQDDIGDSVDIRVRLPEEKRGDMGAISALRLYAPPKTALAAPALVPLGELITYGFDKTPSEIARKDLSRQVVLSANLDGLPLGTAVAKVKEASDRMELAPGYKINFSGEAEDMAESFAYMAEALLLAIIFVYLILAAQFESFIDPLSIMLSLPLSLVGMAGMLRLTNDTISIMSLIGLIMLMGLVTKNAILLVDYAKVLKAGGMERREALITAGRTRLRPIMMTTLAMIFGMLPTAMAIGAGSEMRAPMARAVIGGLITSTILTLIVVPVVYALLDDFGGWIRRKWGSAEDQRHKAAAGLAIFALALSIPALSQASEAQGEAQRRNVEVRLTLDEALKIAAQKSRRILGAIELKNQYQGIYISERSTVFQQISASALARREDDNSSSSMAGGKDSPAFSTFGANIDISQIIFSWGKLNAAVKAAEIGMKSADDEIRTAKQETALGVTAAFCDLLLAKELGELANQNLEQKQKHFDEAKKKFATGIATEYDVLAAEVSVKNARPEAIRASNAIRLAKDNLRYRIGLEGGEIDAEGALQAAPSETPSYETALESAKEKRPELAALSNQIGVYEELVTIAEAGDKPTISFRGGLGWAEIDPAGSPESNGTNWNAGIYATWPLFDGKKTQGKALEAKSQAQAMKIKREDLLASFELAVRDALGNVKESAEVLAGLEGAVQQAEKLLGMAQKGYEYGVKTRLEVEDSQLNLT
ncbi:RND transporter, partial [bacterium]